MGNLKEEEGTLIRKIVCTPESDKIDSGLQTSTLNKIP